MSGVDNITITDKGLVVYNVTFCFFDIDIPKRYLHQD